MKVMRTLKSIALAAVLSLGLPGLMISSPANASPGWRQSIHRYEPQWTAYHYREEYHVASALANCRIVNTNGGRLNVRRTPGGRIVGKLYNGSYVRIVGWSHSGWVRVAGPAQGYVYARYLRYCG